MIGMLPVFSILIIFFSFFRITQYFIGLIELLEFFVCFLIIWVKIGMRLSGEFTIGFFNIFLRCVFINSQRFVIIYELHYIQVKNWPLQFIKLRKERVFYMAKKTTRDHLNKFLRHPCKYILH